MADTLTRLEATIAARRAAAPGSSYVASLFAKGVPKIAQKLGEEAVETVIAALSGDAAEITGEAADLLFHLLVLLEATGVPLAQVMTELDRREGVSGIVEKASRGLSIAPEAEAAPAAPAETAHAPKIAATIPDPEPEPGLKRGRAAPRRPLIRKG